MAQVQPCDIAWDIRGHHGQIAAAAGNYITGAYAGWRASGHRRRREAETQEEQRYGKRSATADPKIGHTEGLRRGGTHPGVPSGWGLRLLSRWACTCQVCTPLTVDGEYELRRVRKKTGQEKEIFFMLFSRFYSHFTNCTRKIKLISVDKDPIKGSLHFYEKGTKI